MLKKKHRGISVVEMEKVFEDGDTFRYSGFRFFVLRKRFGPTQFGVAFASRFPSGSVLRKAVSKRVLEAVRHSYSAWDAPLFVVVLCSTSIKDLKFGPLSRRLAAGMRHSGLEVRGQVL